MRTVAVLPLNHLRLVKSRLSGPRIDRQALAVELLGRVVRLLGELDEVTARWVVSPDPAVSALIGEAEWVPQPGEGLNPALELARMRALEQGFERILVILPDLPFLKSDEVREFLRLAREPRTLALAADRWGRGTNLWLSKLTKGSPLAFRFGEESLAAHQLEASQAGWTTQVFRSPGCERDLDTMDDWEEFRWTLPFNCCR